MYTYANAYRTAGRFAEILSPHCERLDIAGSVRRAKKEVKDIEIVCQPKREIVKDPELLFDEGKEMVSRDFIHALATITDAVMKGNTEGRYMQIKTKSSICSGIYLDLFMPQPQDYYRQLIIRTGSADYVHNVIAAAWKRKGWCGVKDLGLRLISECDSKQDSAGKTTWHLKPETSNPTLPPFWHTEEEVFNWLNLEYVIPANREYKPTINPAQ